MKMINESQSNKVYITLSVIVALSLVIKFLLFDYTYVDYNFYLSKWVEEIKMNGYLNALSEPFYNYTPSYMYILVLIAKLDLNPLYAIKITSIFFEFVLAYFVGRLVFLYSNNEVYRWVSTVLVLLLPTVILNSSLMSQCDSIYASFGVASVYFALTQRNLTAMILLGIAFALKIQVAVLLPVFFVYMLRGQIKWCYFLIIPAVYFISILPVWIAGRPLIDLLTIYLAQSTYNEAPVGGFPNVFLWIWDVGGYYKIFGISVVLLFTLTLGFVLSQKKYEFTLESWYKLILLSVIFCPFFPPGMLERYMYLGDVFSIVYVMICFRKVFVSLAIVFISSISYFKILHMNAADTLRNQYPSDFFDLFTFIPWKGLSIIYIAVIIFVAYGLMKTLQRTTKKTKLDAV